MKMATTIAWKIYLSNPRNFIISIGLKQDFHIRLFNS